MCVCMYTRVHVGCVCLGVCKPEVDMRMSSSVALLLFLFLSYLLCVCKYDVGDTHGRALEWRSKGNCMELIPPFSWVLEMELRSPGSHSL